MYRIRFVLDLTFHPDSNADVLNLQQFLQLLLYQTLGLADHILEVRTVAGAILFSSQANDVSLEVGDLRGV